MLYQELSSAINMASAFSDAASRERYLCVPFPDAITSPSTMEGFTKGSYGQIQQITHFCSPTSTRVHVQGPMKCRTNLERPVSPSSEDLKLELIKNTRPVTVTHNCSAQWCPWLYYQSTQEEGEQRKAHQESCSSSRMQHQVHCELLLYGIKRENESPERLR